MNLPDKVQCYLSQDVCTTRYVRWVGILSGICLIVRFLIKPITGVFRVTPWGNTHSLPIAPNCIDTFPQKYKLRKKCRQSIKHILDRTNYSVASSMDIFSIFLIDIYSYEVIDNCVLVYIVVIMLLNSIFLWTILGFNP